METHAVGQTYETPEQDRHMEAFAAGQMYGTPQRDRWPHSTWGHGQSQVPQ